jgi:NADPH-dependent 2,4-dienoyl-CoA reductase/sulfur reductase-like enzyme
LLPKFDEALGNEVLQGLQELGVRVILNERLDMSSLKEDGGSGSGSGGTRLIKTMKGREFEADLLLLCTGQTPNTTLLHSMDPRTIDAESKMVRVARSMQVLALAAADKYSELDEFDLGGGLHAGASASPTPSSPRTLCGTVPPSPTETLVELDFLPPAGHLSESLTKPQLAVESANVPYLEPRLSIYPHLFAIGDAADAFGAIKAGHTAYHQAEVAARNVIRLVRRDEAEVSAAITERSSRGLTPRDGADKLAEVRGGPEGKAEEELELELEQYMPGPPMIKVSIGLTKLAYGIADVVGTSDDGTEDQGAALMWGAFGYKEVDEEGMWR